MEGPHIVIALEADTDAEVSIEEACAIEGERPHYRCPECGKELIAKCYVTRAPHFAHRFAGTTCLGRRLPREPVATAPAGTSAAPAPGRAPPPAPEQAAAAAPSRAPSHALTSAPAWEVPVRTPHRCFVDVYFKDGRCLQLLALFMPHSPPQGTEGGTLTWYVRDPRQDPHLLDGYPVGEWTSPVTKSELMNSLKEVLAELKQALGAVETGEHFPGFSPAPVPDPRRLPFPRPLRSGDWKLM
jgi:predicted RNA-binding Zn-ribbon protein involved in translation (DUF1610 family)